jgi:hypothetical protein
MSIHIGCIVEGHGEKLAAPLLLRRIANSVDPAIELKTETIKIPRSRILKAGELERTIELLARRIGRDSGVLLLLDSDDDCPRDLAPKLLRRAQAAHGDLAFGVVLPKREYEAWFLAAARSLRGCRGLSEDLEPPDDPEAVRGAKEWLAERMDSASYSEVRDQAALTAQFDLTEAKRSSSFDKCFREVTRLIAEISGRQGPPV